MYSQHDEERVILEVFAGSVPGRFLDVGAGDGREYSNTLRLAELGWEGVLIEPSPGAFPALAERHAGNPKLKCVRACLGLETSEVVFHDAPKWYGTTEAGNVEKWKGITAFTDIAVPQISIADFLRENPGPYDFISIDTEGSSTRLFAAWPGESWPMAWCVEHDGNHAEICRIGREHGYVTRCLDETNIILARPR